MEKAEHDPGLYFEQSSRKSDVRYYLLLYHANHTVGQKTQCNKGLLSPCTWIS